MTKKVKPLFTGSEWDFNTIQRIADACYDINDKELKLDLYPNQFEVITSDQMLDAYASIGMPVLYNHWSFGKTFLQEEHSYRTGRSGLAYELIINSSPSINYLMEENSATVQALVIAHAGIGHNAFFKNNYLFKDWTQADSILDYLVFARKYVAECEERYGTYRVERILDSAHALRNQGVDKYKRVKLSLAEEQKRQKEREEYVQKQVNVLWQSFEEKVDVKDRAEDTFPEEPEENILKFIEKNSMKLESWERELIRIVRMIAQYFHPQRQTKVSNEGFACVTGDTLIDTTEGLIYAKDIVNTKFNRKVWDGTEEQNVVNWFYNEGKNRIKIYTKHGYELHGGEDHKILINNEWVELKNLNIGDKISLKPGNEQWPTQYQKIDYSPEVLMTKNEIGDLVGMPYRVFSYIRAGHRSFKHDKEQATFEAFDELMKENKCYKSEGGGKAFKKSKRTDPTLPDMLTEDLAYWLGIIIGDGGIYSRFKGGTPKVIMLRTDDEEIRDNFIQISKNVFNMDVLLHAAHSGKYYIGSVPLCKYLRTVLDMKQGNAAAIKEVPKLILTSPKSVVKSFIQGLFDTDGCADRGGNAIYVSKSELLSKRLQELLLKFGIFSKRHLQKDGCYSVVITGKNALKFSQEIGFRLTRKQVRIETVHKNRKFYKPIAKETVITKIEKDVGETYDFSVENSHSYQSSVFVNHNCWVHQYIMNRLYEKGLLSEGSMLEFMHVHSNVVYQPSFERGSFNPYALGLNIYKDIERMCKNPTAEDKEWFPHIVGQPYLDVVKDAMMNYRDESFIRQFLSPKLMRDMRMFQIGDEDDDYYMVKHIHNDDGYKDIRRNLANQYELTNIDPDIQVYDANMKGNRHLYLMHRSVNGKRLEEEDACQCLEHVKRLWGFDVDLTSYDKDMSYLESFTTVEGSEEKEGEVSDD